MPPAKPALQPERGSVNSEISLLSGTPRVPVMSPRLAPVVSVTPIRAVPSKAAPGKETSFQPRVPVITGEAHYRGSLAVDGIISGQLGASASSLIAKQRPRNGANIGSAPELDGEISFKDMLRINGHIAGKVFSYKGTLIVDASARVDADIDVKVCVISGIVNGDVIAHEKVELGPAAVINGNIATRAITMKPGAVFHGDCRMFQSEDEDS
jgi:cytoskeletal protein CcmA (bactofilin family)